MCSPLVVTILMLAIVNCLLDEECAPKADKGIDSLCVTHAQLVSQGLRDKGALCTLIKKDVSFTVSMVVANSCYSGFQE